MTNHCAGLFGRLFGHDYQARHSIGEPTFGGYQGHFTCSEFHIEAMLDLSRPCTYNGDVCRRCGDVKNAPQEERK